MSKFLPNVTKLVSIISILFAGAIFIAPQFAAAAYDIPVGGVELEGFAWSGYEPGPLAAMFPGPSTGGIGWISMNCSNTGTCGTSNYAVTLENSGNLSGYAWASNVINPITGASLGPGWVHFDPVGPYPSGADTLAASAGATSGSFTGDLNFGGWARFCVATVDPATCSGAATVRAGGWDGWVSLAGSAAGGYGITMTSAGVAAADAYAWGGPLVVGWVDFSPSGYPPVSYSTTTLPPDVTILTPTGPVPLGPVTITFDPIGGGGAPDSCTYFDGSSTNSIALTSPVTSNESFVVNPLVDTTYTITCTNSGGSDSDTVLVELFSDLIIDSVTITKGSIVAGNYDTVGFTVTVSGVPTSASNVPYTVELGGTTKSGTFDGSSAIGGVVTIIDSFSSVPISATPAGWEVIVDPPSAAPPNGVVPEGGGPAEINEDSGTLDLPAPPPTITIDADAIIRTGTEAEVEITVTSVGPSDCEVFGPGLTGTPAASFTVAAGTTYVTAPPLETDPLNNRTVVAVECTVVGGPAVRQGATIEVTASFQEV